MLCICRRTCQEKRDSDGKIIFYEEGSVSDFKKCPLHFEALEGKEAKDVNFESATGPELLAREFELSELKSYIKEQFGMKAGNRGKEKTIALLLDCRERAVVLPPGVNTPKDPKEAHEGINEVM